MLLKREHAAEQKTHTNVGCHSSKNVCPTFMCFPFFALADESRFTGPVRSLFYAAHFEQKPGFPPAKERGRNKTPGRFNLALLTQNTSA